MDNVPGIDLLPAHCALLERAVDHFRNDGRVTAVILGGSLARSIADFYSDIDLYVVARDGFFDAVFDERNAAALALGSPLFRFTVDAIPGGSRDYIITYPGPVKLDLMYHRESEIVPAPKWAGCVALKDASGLIEDVQVRSRDLAPPTPTSEELLELDQNFWTLAGTCSGRSCAASSGRRSTESTPSGEMPSCPCATGQPEDPTKVTGDSRPNSTPRWRSA